jgi:hypothetical protein
MSKHQESPRKDGCTASCSGPSEFSCGDPSAGPTCSPVPGDAMEGWDAGLGPGVSDRPAVVMDLGSGWTRLGFAGNDKVCASKAPESGFCKS